MVIDPTQPWGIALDYFGRATVTEGGHTVHIRIHDDTSGSPVEPDPVSGTHPTVYVSAQLRETGGAFSVLYGSGDVLLPPTAPGPVPPNHTAVPQAVAAALADFEARRAAYATLCATWQPPAGP
ncbi:ATP-binding protein [Streptomyces sp. NPDC051018]|uniref:ATP-binding protein n=1 Tax=Streptomyces sp. NPDC051018 TaxID=3365639 RepID=UPI00378F15AB